MIFAVQHFARTCNVTLGRPFNTAWAARHGEEWSAPLYPFGCLVHVMPNEAAGAALPKCAPKSVPAIFLSWHFQPGHVWDGQMCVAPLSQFEGETLACGTFTRAPAVWRTQEV